MSPPLCIFCAENGLFSGKNILIEKMFHLVGEKKESDGGKVGEQKKA